MVRAGPPVVVLALAAALAGCGVPSSEEVGLVPGPPVRWIVVEAPAGELPSRGRWPEGGLRPHAQVLTLAAVPEEGMTWTPQIHASDYFVEIVDVDPEGPVGVGEVVTLTVRVGNAKPHAEYRLSVCASVAETRLMGPQEALVRGSETAQFSFTKLSDGTGGISVTARALQ